MTAALLELLQRPDVWRGDSLAHTAQATVATGYPALDAQLPGGGWPTGCLTELLLAQRSVGEWAVLRPALLHAMGAQGWLALLAPPLQVYAPALQQAGFDVRRIVIVETNDAKDLAWSFEQILASGAFAAALAWLPEVEPAVLRRLQGAMEGQPTLAFVMRSMDAARHASPAPLRLAVDMGQGGVSLRVLKRRGAPLATPVALSCGLPVAGRVIGHRARPVAPRARVSAASS